LIERGFYSKGSSAFGSDGVGNYDDGIGGDRKLIVENAEKE